MRSESALHWPNRHVTEGLDELCFSDKLEKAGTVNLKNTLHGRCGQGPKSVDPRFGKSFQQFGKSQRVKTQRVKTSENFAEEKNVRRRYFKRFLRR